MALDHKNIVILVQLLIVNDMLIQIMKEAY